MRSITAADFLRYAVVTDPQISADGLHAACVVTMPDIEADDQTASIWMAAVDGSSPARCVVAGPATAPRFSPDGQWLAYLAGRGAGQQLYVAPRAGGEARQLTHFARAATQPTWAPDSSCLACITRDGGRPAPAPDDPRAKNAGRVVRHLREAFDGTGWLDGTARVALVALDATTRWLTGDDADADSPAWSPDGRAIAFVSDREPGARDRVYRGDVWVIAAEGESPPRKLTESTGPVAHPVWSPDGASIAYLGNDAGDAMWAAPSDVRVVPAAGGGIVRLTKDWDRSAGARGVLEGGQLAWTDDGQSLLFMAVDRGHAGLWRIGVLPGDGPPQAVVTGDRHVPALAVNGDTVVFAERGVDTWPALGATTLDGGAERVIAEPNAALAAEVELRPVERISHVADDGLEIESFVIRPATDAASKPKLLLDIHGGPHGWHPSPAARVFALHQLAAASGYVVVLPNPRGSLGYGAKFTEAVVRDWGGADFDDVIGATDAAIAATGADPDQQFLWGYSYGGYLASWAIGHTERFRAAVIGAPVADLLSMALTSDITGFSIFENGHPFRDLDLLRERSPVVHLANATTPSLVIVHDGDLRCPPSQAHEVFTALRLAGCETELVRYPGGFHGVAAPSQIVDQLERSMAWFATAR